MSSRRDGAIVGLLAVLLSLPWELPGQVAGPFAPAETEPAVTQPAASAAVEQPADSPAVAPKPRLWVTTDRNGGRTLTIEFSWQSYARPSMQVFVIGESQPAATAIQPLALDGPAAVTLWESLVGKINKPVHAGSDELLQTVTTFLPAGGGSLLRVRAMVNALGKPAAYGLESKDRSIVVFYLLEGWSDAPDTFHVRWSDLDRGSKLAEAPQLRVWFLSEEKIVWEETIAGTEAKPEKAEHPQVVPAPAAAVTPPLPSVPPIATPSAVVEPPLAGEPTTTGMPPATTLVSPAPATSMAGSGAGQSPTPAVRTSETLPTPPAVTTPPALTASLPASPFSYPPAAASASAGSAPAVPAASDAPLQPPSEPAAKAQTPPAAAATAVPPNVPPRGQSSGPGGGDTEPDWGSGVKNDPRGMTIDQLAAYIEQRWGTTMEPAVRRAWAGGWWNYYKVENPDTVRREVFMKLLKTCYREQPPSELRECFALLYLRLKQKQ